jgi:hypothetical protein
MPVKLFFTGIADNAGGDRRDTTTIATDFVRICGNRCACKVYVDPVESLLKIHADSAARDLLPSFGWAIAWQSTQTERAD